MAMNIDTELVKNCRKHIWQTLNTVQDSVNVKRAGSKDAITEACMYMNVLRLGQRGIWSMFKNFIRFWVHLFVVS